MHAALISFGSSGDVLPHVGLGAALRGRGHRVSFVGSAYFRPLAEAEGLEFIELYSAAEYLEQVQDRNRWTGAEALRRGGERILDKIEKAYRIVADLYVPGATVVAAQGWVFGARIAQEKLGVPLATVHLQPLCLLSLSEGNPGSVRRLMCRGLERLVDRVSDRSLGPRTNAFRAGLGLPPACRLLRTWCHSPQQVLGLFPEWFAAPQPTWPPNTRLLGFPLHDGGWGGGPCRKEVEVFLSAGEPPLVFSQNSWMKYAQDYFAASVETAKLLGRRAVLLTPYAEQVPASLPPGVRHFDYVPHSWLLPRAAAHVHPGGIGTLAQTLAAGVPQLIVPGVYDQPDNARRLERLGVSATLRPSAYHPGKVARKLQALLDSPAVRERCRRYAERCQEGNALASACGALEQLFAGSRGKRR